MENPGVYVLFAGTITTALSDYGQEPVVDLDGMKAATIVARFVYGSGGTSLAAVIQTSLDGGATWIDVARLDFATSSAVKSANLSGTVSKGVAAVNALSSEGVNDGVLASQFRAKLSSVGTYAGDTLLDLRLVAR